MMASQTKPLSCSPLEILGNSDFFGSFWQREIWAKLVFKEVSMFFLLLFRGDIYFLLYPEVGVVNPVKSHETVVA